MMTPQSKKILAAVVFTTAVSTDKCIAINSGANGCSNCLNAGGDKVVGAQCVRGGANWFQCYRTADECCDDGQIAWKVDHAACVANYAQADAAGSDDPSTAPKSTECDNVVSKDSSSTNKACQEKCRSIVDQGGNIKTHESFTSECMVEGYGWKNGRVQFTGQCFDGWIHGYLEPASLAGYRTIYDVKTPALCQAECQADPECVRFAWATPEGISGHAITAHSCILKNQMQVTVPGTIKYDDAETNPPEYDEKYCNFQTKWQCFNGFACATCDSDTSYTCIWGTNEHISGWKYCPNSNVCHIPEPANLTTSAPTSTDTYSRTRVPTSETTIPPPETKSTSTQKERTAEPTTASAEITDLASTIPRESTETSASSTTEFDTTLQSTTTDLGTVLTSASKFESTESSTAARSAPSATETASTSSSPRTFEPSLSESVSASSTTTMTKTMTSRPTQRTSAAKTGTPIPPTTPRSSETHSADPEVKSSATSRSTSATSGSSPATLPAKISESSSSVEAGTRSSTPAQTTRKSEQSTPQTTFITRPRETQATRSTNVRTTPSTLASSGTSTPEAGMVTIGSTSPATSISITPARNDDTFTTSLVATTQSRPSELVTTTLKYASTREVTTVTNIVEVSTTASDDCGTSSEAPEPTADTAPTPPTECTQQECHGVTTSTLPPYEACDKCECGHTCHKCVGCKKRRSDHGIDLKIHDRPRHIRIAVDN